MPTPRQLIPAVGECRFDTHGDLLAAAAISCADRHDYETVYVGAFTGSTAARVLPPPAGSPAVRDAYAKCQTPAAKYLGASWYAGMVTLSVVVPDDAGWVGGARWFLCDVNKTAAPGTEALEENSISVRDALAPGNALRLTCVTWLFVGSGIDNFERADCAKPHNGEFAGVFEAPDIPFPSDKSFTTMAEDGCEGVVGKFLGFRGASDYFNDTVGYAWTWVSEEQWIMGDRDIRCYASAFTKDRKFIGSVKGIRDAHAKG
jgi:hypothetical protein